MTSDKKNENKKKEVVEELSEEDLKLKNDLEMLVERLKESNVQLYKPSIEQLRVLIKSETSTMTSVPKPLKFLLEHYPVLAGQVYQKLQNEQEKRLLADVLSILGMTMSGKRECLKYRLLGTSEGLTSWGHEYLKRLSLELIESTNEDGSQEDLIRLAKEIIPYFCKNNAEADACDLAIELELLEYLKDYVHKDNYERVCLYVNSCAAYLTTPDDKKALEFVYQVYLKFNKYSEGLLTLLKLNPSQDEIDQLLSRAKNDGDELLLKQLELILMRIKSIESSNVQLTEMFKYLAKELDVEQAKTPEDLYKTHLENKSSSAAAVVDSAKQNLASIFVNAFVNCGFCSDKLILTQQEDANFIYKNKSDGMLSASASIGALMLWDIDNGLSQLDKYLYSADEYIKSGALLGIGINSINTRNESDPSLALLSEFLSFDHSVKIRSSAIYGLGLAYAGSQRTDIAIDLLQPIILDSTLSLELSALAALSAALIMCGSACGDLSSTLIQVLMERDEDQLLNDQFSRLLPLSLGLLYLQRHSDQDLIILETIKVLPVEQVRNQCHLMVKSCAYAASGNVLQIQELLSTINDDGYIGNELSCLGIALIAIGEDYGQQMSHRLFQHLMHYGELGVKRMVPLALGLLSASNPQLNVLDTLSKYSHDNDKFVSMNSIIALGLLGAGTNNARLAQMLRQLASYYHREPNHLFCVRLAQGFLHLGKGTMSLSPLCFNRELTSLVALSGLLTLVMLFTDSERFILNERHHYLMYSLLLSVYPRFLVTVDEHLQPVHCLVRVGQAVDTVGQAGRPKTITGFQTHTTPVLLGFNERAELATEEYIPMSPVLEGLVICKKNPDYIQHE